MSQQLFMHEEDCAGRRSEGLSGVVASEGRSSKRIAILQSSYIPWKGYFDIIRAVDEFVLLDEAQFTRRDWRNRNRIKTAHGPIWLSIPVHSKGRRTQAIDESVIAGPWAEKHWTSLQMSYGRAPYFRALAPAVQALYARAEGEPKLSAVNALFLRGLCEIIGITTPITTSRDYAAQGTRTDRIVSICRGAGASHYLSGPSAKAYLETEKFAAAGIGLSFTDYAGYPEYPQSHGAFEHHVSILDLLFHTGPDAAHYMRQFAR